MPKYDRELIARMLETPAVFEDASRHEQARLLREAENLEADARTVVRDERGSDPRVDDDSFSAAISACRSQLGARRPDDSEPEEQWMWDKLTKLESLLSAASGEGVDDTKRLDWIARQGGYEFDFGILNDQPGDGDWFVHGMGGSGQGATFRDAIDAAIKEEAGGQDANTDILDTLAFKTENGDAGRGYVTYIALVASGEADHQQNAAQGGGAS